jgi:hypothetical protein
MNLTGQTSQTKELGETRVHNQKMPTKTTQSDLVIPTVMNLVGRKKRGCCFTVVESLNPTKFLR